MARQYHPLRYRLDKADRYLLWFTDYSSETDEPDGVVVDAGGQAVVFRSKTELAGFAASNQLAPLDGGTETSLSHNLDVVARWLRVKNRRKARQIDCQEFLNAWNLLTDVSASTGGDFDPDHARTRRVYEKLFYGNNLPSVTPVGRYYEPIWSWADVKLLREILGEGLALLRERTAAGWLEPPAR